MTKKFKKNSTIRTITSVALAAMLLFSMALPSFAGGGNPPKVTTAGVTKIYAMPEGTIFPGDRVFDFTVIKFAVDEENVSDKPELALTMPDVSVPAISVTSTSNKLVDGGVQYYRAQTGDIFAGKVWPHAGMFVYHITETKAGQIENLDSDLAGYPDNLYYSSAVYKLSVLVKEVNGVLVIDQIIAQVVNKDDGTPGGEKIDPTPGNDGEGTFSKLAFTNIFVKNNGKTDPGNPGDPDGPKLPPEEIVNYTTLKILKEVDTTNEYAEKNRPFTFDITVSKPAIGVDLSDTYAAYVMDGNSGSPVIISKTYFSVETLKSIELKHGQWLAFTDMPVGSYFTVKENGTPGYTPSYKLTVAGGTPIASPNDGSIKQGDDLSINKTLIGDVKPNGSLAEFLNKYKNIEPPTGINVNNLPYVILTAMAVIVLVGYALSKTRKAAKANKI